MQQDIKIVKYGNHERKSFSKTKEVLPLPNLIEVQKSSYRMFIDKGIREVFEDFSPIEPPMPRLCVSPSVSPKRLRAR